MDLHRYNFLIFIITSIFVIDAVPSLHNETYNGYTLFMPLTDGDTQSPLTLPSSNAEQWCSSINSTLPRITDQSDQKNIVQFIESAIRKHNLSLDRIQTVFVNSIHHSAGNWTWVNGQTNQGFTVGPVSNKYGADRYVGYLYSDYYYRISECRPSEQRRYICETSEHSSNSSHCEIKLDKRCYWKKDVALPWFKARDACLNEGGDLASFEQLNERNLKVSLKDLGLNAGKSYWVGIYNLGVWRWNDKGKDDSEIKYSNWKPGHPSNYDAKCLCLDKQSNYTVWIECECNKDYPFICKRNESETLKSSTEYPRSSTEDFTRRTHTAGIELSTSESETLKSSTEEPRSSTEDFTRQKQTASVELSTSDASTVIGAVVSCVIIVVMIIVVVVVIILRKHGNRPVNSFRYETSEAKTMTTTNDYVPVQEPGENQSTTNCSASNTAYATIEPAANTIDESQANTMVYAELDLLPPRA